MTYRTSSFASPCKLLLPLLLLGLFLGCGAKGSHVSGKVTFKGKPVPEGKVYFLPDAAAGNRGTPGYADIKNGAYDTGAEGGQAPSPGAVVMTLEGVDPNPPASAPPGVVGTTLFKGYEKKITLSDSTSVQDVEVPDEAATDPATAAIVQP